MQGKVCVVTGATSGIGLEAARGLASMGAHVVMAGRNPDKAHAAADEVRATATGPVDVVLADFAALASVRRLAEEVSERYPRIDVLLSNAGVYRLRRQVTGDGYEEMFAVNHLAAFLFVNLLLDRLRDSAPSRVVMVASEAHYGATLDFDDLQSERGFRSMRVYGKSKLGNVMTAYALARRLEGSGVTANSLHPGFVATNLGSGNRIPVKPFMALFRLTGRAIGVRDGADTPIYLASSPDVEGVTGKYFDNRREKMSSPQSYDTDAQERLYAVSEALTGLQG
ncbi:MAG: SDR family oxidoreductase [Actinobacteria bacterium]|nr:MAG: SDR family oxidoreductase [Actinomycetota bacterium]